MLLAVAPSTFQAAEGTGLPVTVQCKPRQAYAEAVQLEKTAMQGDRVLCVSPECFAMSPLKRAGGVETCCPLQLQPLGAGAQLCQVTAKFLASQHVALPPGPDIGCYQDPEGAG